MKKIMLLLTLVLSLSLFSCTTHNSYHYYDGDVHPTENIEEQIQKINQREVVILDTITYSFGKDGRITTQTTNVSSNIEVVVPEFKRLTVEGDVTFNVTDLDEIEAWGYLDINAKYNKLKNFETIVLRVYTINANDAVGLVGNYDGETIPFYGKNNDFVSDYTEIPNEIASAGLFDYLELDTWGLGGNHNLKKAIRVKDMPLYFMADFSDAIDQTYTTTIVIEMAGVLK